MAKLRQFKEDSVKQLGSALHNSKAVVFANIQGLTVNDTQTLKKQGKAQGVKSTMAKKTLLRRAFQERGFTVDPKTFEGGIGVFWSEQDEVGPAKVVATFAKQHTVVSIFGGVFEVAFITTDDVKWLAAIPSKEELLAKFVGTIANPLRGLVTILAGPQRGFVTVLDAIAKQKS